MCACEPGYVCSCCKGTPRDDRYLDDEPRDHDEFVTLFDAVLRKHTGHGLDNPPWPKDDHAD